MPRIRTTPSGRNARNDWLGTERFETLDEFVPPEQEVISIGLTPFIRENDINFAARNLKPDATANLFFDEIKVNNFAQRASVINVTSSGVLSNVRVNQGVYGSTSKAYAEVLGTSLTGTQNLLYVNDNFLTIQVAKSAGSADLADSDFAVDQLIYQTASNSAFTFSYINPATVQPNFTFLGKVKKWERISGALGYLVVDPILGMANTSLTNTGSNRLFNLTTFLGQNREAVVNMANNRFRSGESVVYAANGGSLGTVSSSNSYVALSSIVTGANTINTRSIVISSNNISRDGVGDIVGNTITIVSGTNMGFSANVVAIAANTVRGWNEAIIDADLPAICSGNSVYSIGKQTVDDVGSLYGIFHIPSEDNLRWLTGERVFTITDTATFNDNAYKMRAISKYTALGRVNTAENARNFVLREQTPSTQQAAPSVIVETPKVNDRKYMAQTFFTPTANTIVNGEVKNGYGLFLTSVDLFFKSKPTDNDELLPFTVAISKVQSDLPSNDIIAERTLDAGYIKVSNSPSFSNTSTNTRFTFMDPVYLLPGTEYAIKLITESPDYEVWTATLGGEYIDETGNTRRISDQPYIGKFFKSQNASNWNPILNQDLMFRVNRALFSTENSVSYLNLKPSAELQSNTIADLVKLQVTEQKFAPTTVSYELNSYLVDGTQTGFISINNNEIYDFGKDTNISSPTSKRRRVIPAANVNAMNVKVTMTTTDDSVAPIINRERISLYALQSIINNAGIANNLISITSPGNHVVAGDIAVTISAPDIGTDRATANVLPGMLSGGKLTAINIINPGSGYLTTPTITIVEAAASTNATAAINGETDASGGNLLNRYQTKIVTLDDGFDAGDLIVRLNARKPQGTDIAVYFKVLSALDADSFVSKKWKKMTVVSDRISADQNQVVPLEYRYSLTNGYIQYLDGEKSLPLGGTFKYFAIKIGLVAADPTVVPAVESMRVIAVPGG